MDESNEIVISDTYLRELGIIEKTSLGPGDNYNLGFCLHMSFGARNQGFGVYDTTHPCDREDHTARTIKLICFALGIERWEDAKGRQAYALRTERNGFIRGIQGYNLGRPPFMAQDICDCSTALNAPKKS